MWTLRGHFKPLQQKTNRSGHKTEHDVAHAVRCHVPDESRTKDRCDIWETRSLLWKKKWVCDHLQKEEKWFLLHLFQRSFEFQSHSLHFQLRRSLSHNIKLYELIRSRRVPYSIQPWRLQIWHRTVGNVSCLTVLQHWWSRVKQTVLLLLSFITTDSAACIRAAIPFTNHCMFLKSFALQWKQESILKQDDGFQTKLDSKVFFIFNPSKSLHKQFWKQTKEGRKYLWINLAGGKTNASAFNH